LKVLGGFLSASSKSPEEVYGDARRTSVVGTVAPSTKETELNTIRPWYVKLLQCVKEYIIKPK